jgi:diguanylate cyclase (GGDEF)-like protein
VVAWEALAVDVGAGHLAVSAATAATVTVTVATAIFVRLMLSTAARLVAIRLLAIALGLSMLVVLQYASTGMTNSPALDHEWELLAVLVYGTIAAAVLHPSFRSLVDDDAYGPETPHGTARAVTLCAAVIVPSAVTLFRAITAARDTASHWSSVMSVPPAFVGVLITFGVSWRLAQLVREREETHRLLRHRSLHDDLTGLPNRAYLLERLERQINRMRAHPVRADIGFGLMFLDLDGFKSINDTYGHHAGDAVLVDVARRLGDTVRTDDFIGRMAGDEFVLLCGQPSDEPSLQLLAERLRKAVEAPLPAEFGVVTPKVSIGIVAVDREMVSARDAVSVILREADARMYEKKAASREPAEPTPTPTTHRRTDPPKTSAADHDEKPRVS